ncbi:hypothetical protein EI42_06271 [Thermosporothrix hazakensis]|jgi:magnesium-transporting ATPase (P-type)|uniref:Uncharacterized protein n=1 Tax=Thermosporothrix hazakensis TaxID=644383 RepID=A0A326TZZ3_THEHA|nr:hypothetical protein [Thermosporothrix hazakensis]PZW18233.1 hypothetical protein EI42_06271 [Thermosporothrix hazakensis]GCE48619.1 hypothetical protein KTH_34880 [Thermosporothrix hazakensis]
MQSAEQSWWDREPPEQQDAIRQQRKRRQQAYTKIQWARRQQCQKQWSYIRLMLITIIALWLPSMLMPISPLSLLLCILWPSIFSKTISGGAYVWLAVISLVQATSMFFYWRHFIVASQHPNSNEGFTAGCTVPFFTSLLIFGFTATLVTFFYPLLGADFPGYAFQLSCMNIFLAPVLILLGTILAEIERCSRKTHR